MKVCNVPFAPEFLPAFLLVGVLWCSFGFRFPFFVLLRAFPLAQFFPSPLIYLLSFGSKGPDLPCAWTSPSCSQLGFVFQTSLFSESQVRFSFPLSGPPILFDLLILKYPPWDFPF